MEQIWNRDGDSGLENRRLGPISLAALLVAAHYGLGFLLGTAEEAMTVGVAGSLYPVSIALGMIVLLSLVRFYWTEVEQIWTLLGDRYGTPAKILIGLMSWLSLIGIEAVQIISAAFILKTLGFAVLPSMVGIAIASLLISLLPLQGVSRLLQALLLLNILALVYSLWTLHGVADYLRSPLDFVTSLDRIRPSKLVGIPVSTVLLVMIDMKCQQFIVQAKNTRVLYQGCLLAAFTVFLLAFLPSAVVSAALHASILPAGLDRKQVIPYVLVWVGSQLHPLGGLALILALLIPALGVGSSILRIQTKTVLDVGIVPASLPSRLLITTVNAGLALAVALRGTSIVGLIVEFYAAYIAAVWVPFAAYLLTRSRIYEFCDFSVKLSLGLGSLTGVVMLLLTLTLREQLHFASPELVIMAAGLIIGALGLTIGQLVDPYLPSLATEEEGTGD